MFGQIDEGYDLLPEEFIGKLPTLGATVLSELKHGASSMSEDRRSVRDRFSRRLQHKWGRPLRLLRILLEATRESGELYNSVFRPAATAEQDFVFETLVRLHARACLIASEILWLMEGGFASGAMSRWRTLHELNTVAYFILDQGPECAERYLLHHHVETSKSAVQYQLHSQRLGLEPLTDEKLKEHQRQLDELCAQFGQPYRKDWGWAATALNVSHPTFALIEQAVSLEHMRPYFRFSCHPNHAGSKGINYDLGTTLTPEVVGMALAGPSDAGLSEPGICTAFSLYELTRTLLLHRDVSQTALIVVEALRQLQQETQESFAQAIVELEARAPRVRERLERFKNRHGEVRP